MMKIAFRTLSLLLVVLTSCNQSQKSNTEQMDQSAAIKTLFQNYQEARMKISPLEATFQGDNRYNNVLPNDISQAYRESLRIFFKSYLDSLAKFNPDNLNESDRYSFEILQYEMETSLKGLEFKDYLMPINQFTSLTLVFGQLGTGQGAQPFLTPSDYENWLGRVNGFNVWCDTAIQNMKQGIQEGIVQNKTLMERVLPQLKDMLEKDVKKSIFYMPITNMPADFSATDKARLDSLYQTAILTQIIPSYQKLYDFIKVEYIPHCQENAGIGNLPGGKEMYGYLAHLWTTTELTPDSIFNLGQSEVKRLRGEMEKVMIETGYKGDLRSFFAYLNADRKFFPFTTAAEVLDSFHNIHEQMKPQLSKLFNKVPKTKFEIRETEKFREASASAEYSQGTPDGSRPGIFYTPIPDPKKFNSFGMEDLFLHEAIPGHHYQISLAQENDSLPVFRRFLTYGAYVEGWALYTESLGKELGLYKDPYQYFASLSEEMHRALRLVVDVGMHLKGWTREQAIEFSLENEGESKEAITSEVERYMAYPGQALCYKVGQLKIRELRHKAEQELGERFNLASFHDAVLDSGGLPLSVLEQKINRWIETQKKNV
ncbi:MAG: DUF885 domain-containing protein [Bacteroidetes bacterium]|nr:DUF885 domain-containing protein [Bacteroidota bacterium]